MGIVLRHATLRKNLPSIGRLGLLGAKSKGRLKVVWVHAASKTPWATLHTVKRHGGRVEDVVVLEVEVPRGWLRRSRRGLWYSTEDIPPARIRRAISFAEVAGPSVDETSRRELALAAG
jgi:hypothetical protein